MDSTSNLFSRLDLDKNSARPHHEDMDDMDIDLVEEARVPSFSPGAGSRRKKHTHHRRDYGPQTFASSSTARNDTEQQHRRARLVQLISNALETAHSSYSRDEVLESEQNKPRNGAFFEKSPKPPAFATRHSRNKGSWRKKDKEQFSVIDIEDLTLKSREKREKREKRGGISARRDPYRNDVTCSNQGQMRVDGQRRVDLVEEIHTSAIENNKKDRMKGLVSYPASQPRTGQGHQRWSQFASPPKNTGQNKLLPSDCTSHYNEGWYEYAAKDNGVYTFMRADCLDGNLLHHVVSPGSESRHIGKEKGKMIMENSVLNSGQDIKDEFHSERLEVAKEVSASIDDNAVRSFENVDWRSNAPAFPSEESACVSKREAATSSHLPDLRHKITMEYQDDVNHDDIPEMTAYHRLNPSSILAPEPATRNRGSRRRQNFMKGKRECNSIYSSYGGSSSSTVNNSEMLHLQSSMHIPRVVNSQRRSYIFDPVIELDEMQSPVARCYNLQEQSSRIPDHSSARISQVESDEMLARQLQEQFYEEVAGSASTVEIDATIAWSLQQEDARLAASTARSGQPHNREATMAHLYEYYARLADRNSSARSSNHPESRMSNRRRNYYGSELDLETRMMAEVRNFMGMDSGMRRNFLEELEAAFDQSNDALAESALEGYTDFNEYDYETLLALDENNQQHAGASEGQINSLPQSVIQNDGVEEACAICLENHSAGDIIRRLPCFHKFHQDCIDPWLRRRTSCPVCKSDVLLNG